MPASINKVLSILKSNPLLVERHVEFCGTLEIPTVDITPFSRLHRSATLPAYELLKEILVIWINRYSTNATISVLITAVERMELNSTADLLRELIKNESSNEILQIGQENANQCVTTIAEISGGKAFFTYPEVFGKLLQKAGSKRVIILSINGRTRMGKSFRINQFLKYLSDWNLNGIKDSTGSWINMELENSFEFKQTASPVTFGIQVWNEPFFIENGEIAVFLMDCQGMHETRTDSKMTSKLFAFSLLLSSVFIYLDKEDSKDVMDSISLLANLANSLKSNGDTSSILQKFIFQKRDHSSKDYSPGLYNEGCPAGGLSNFKTWIFSKNKVLKSVLESISNYVAFYLMPHPRVTQMEQLSPDQWDTNFSNYLKDFVVSTFMAGGDPEACVKRVGGQALTASETANYAKLVATYFSGDNAFPDLPSVFAAAMEWQGRRGLNSGINLYKTGINEFFANERDGASNEVLESRNNILKVEALRLFENSVKLLTAEDKTRFLSELTVNLEALWQNAKTENGSRLESANARNEFNQQAQNDQAQTHTLNEQISSFQREINNNEATTRLLQDEMDNIIRRGKEQAKLMVTTAEKQLAAAMERKAEVVGNRDTHNNHDTLINEHQGTVYQTNVRLNDVTYNQAVSNAQRLVDEAQHNLDLARVGLAQYG